MVDLIPVKNENLARDPNTGVIHNTDKEAFLSFIAHRNAMKTNKERVETLEVEVTALKEGLNQVQSTLGELVDLIKSGQTSKGRTNK